MIVIRFPFGKNEKDVLQKGQLLFHARFVDCDLDSLFLTGENTIRKDDLGGSS